MIKKTKSKEPVIDMGFDLTAKTPDLKKKKKKKKVEPTTALAVLEWQSPWTRMLRNESRVWMARFNLFLGMMLKHCNNFWSPVIQIQR
jgi:hypothetical protein